MALYSEIAKELKDSRDELVSIETIRMQICIVIWNRFGI